MVPGATVQGSGMVQVKKEIGARLRMCSSGRKWPPR